MYSRFKHHLHTFALLLVVVFLVLPCTAKREIKQQLGIPVMELSEKNTTAGFCVETETKRPSAYQQGIRKSQNDYPVPYTYIAITATSYQQKPLPVPFLYFTVHVPLYKKNEQFLI
ncbi:hypothetical protein [Flavobacterium kingsejongi]|uniref:Uncharacterized protein n=1 Tax=Flavobacterium kingsejongi TaxID=1678728 RepID=A0A2S1LQF4_9FLAO|nr:hypothetical protein [Flavobacterium kingsejongi]AWG25977.1 hypothetical protein FK004_12470 [Flavobacterium kingsejongi]